MRGLAPETMLPEKYRRLWRRRLRRRPLLPVLALALAVICGGFVFLVHYQSRHYVFWPVVLGCGVAKLGLASAWITTSWRLIWLRLIAVILLLAMIVAAALPMREFPPNDRLMYWASGAVMCLLVVGVTAILSWLFQVVVERVHRAARSIAAKWACPHCGKSYAIADEPPSRTSKKLRPKLIGLLGLTTVVAILSSIGSNVEWRQVYGGLDGVISFLALCMIFPVVVVTNRYTQSKLWRAIATLVVVATASMTIDFPPGRVEAFKLCTTIGLASHFGIWLASPRPSIARKKVLAAPHEATVAVLAEPS